MQITDEMIRKASAACRRVMFEKEDAMPTWEELMRAALSAALSSEGKRYTSAAEAHADAANSQPQT